MASRSRKAVLLRLDPALHEALQAWAADELRSFNAQVELTLRRALQREGRLSRAAPAPPEDDEAEGGGR